LLPLLSSLTVLTAAKTGGRIAEMTATTAETTAAIAAFRRR
jgi:hypothetical protein